jgi:hypothetical protein
MSQRGDERAQGPELIEAERPKAAAGTIGPPAGPVDVSMNRVQSSVEGLED